MKQYSVSTKVYLDKIQKCYYRILTLNTMPDGPLKNIVSRVKREKLSEFEGFGNQGNRNCDMRDYCYYAIKDPNNPHDFLCVDAVNDLFEFALNNGYTVDTELSKLLMKQKRLNGANEFICFLRYET